MFDLLDKQTIGTIAAIIATAGNLPYLHGVLTRKIKPHLFSWVIWGTIISIAAGAQFAAGAGAGFWTTAATAVFCVAVALLSLSRGTYDASRADWVVFLAALCAIPLWVVTRDPTASVVLVSAINIAGMLPSMRKAYHDPWREGVVNFAVGFFGWVASIFALEQINLAALVYPLSGVVVCGGMSTLVLLRRRRVARDG